MPLSTASANALLDSWGTNNAKFISLHSAYSASGANEISGGSPAYARLTASWASASSNSKALSGTPYNFNVPACTVAWLGFWSLVSGGTFAGMIPAGNAQAFAFSAPSSSSTLLAPGSSYAATQQVVAFPTGGSTMPTGLTAGTVYFVSAPSSDSFKLAATSGGTAINLSADGSGYAQAITPELFAGQGVFTLSAGTVSLV
jgi:hypothetical protein